MVRMKDFVLRVSFGRGQEGEMKDFQNPQFSCLC